MKTFLLSLFLLLSSISFAASSVEYSVTRGKFHRGGKLEVTYKKALNSTVDIQVNYDIQAKRFMPFPKEYLKGEYVQNLPESFLYEETYLELEKSKSMELKDAKVYHLGRKSYGRYTNCHVIKIVAKNGKSELVALYHPIVDVTGWVKIDLKIKKIPVVKTYSLTALLKD